MFDLYDVVPKILTWC